MPQVTREEALELMGYNKFKVEMINQLMDAGTTTTVCVFASPWLLAPPPPP